jgi:predicted solute-binding protein
MVHGPQRSAFDLRFEVPSVCADLLESGDTDIGLVPCAELDRLQLGHLPDLGIACRGAVRSILLITKRPPREIRTLAADANSRSSVMLSRIIVAERYGATPDVVTMPPDLKSMLDAADACLIIGDPALAVDPATVPYQVLDLGAEWMELTGLPMVFAVWAGRPAVITDEVGEVFAASYRFGQAHMDPIIEEAVRKHGVSHELARKYLTENIVFELGQEERRGLAAYRAKVAEFRRREQGSPAVLVP